MFKFLFTTLPSNDLGLLTRSLPIAAELTQRGHTIAFCSPAKAPKKLIHQTGFVNLTPPHPLYYINPNDISLKGMLRLIMSNPMKSYKIGRIKFLLKLVQAMPRKLAPQTSEVWNMDHAFAMAGLMNINFIRANCDAYIKMIQSFEPDILIDFWNPFACIAAKTLKIPLISVMQADQHPANKGLIWWKEPPDNIPSALPAINKVLTQYGLKTVLKVEELSLGDLTLIVGSPETELIKEKIEGIFIGPILWQSKHADLPKWLNKLNDDKPLIWVYSGNPRYTSKSTVFDSELILSTSIRALADEDIHVILTTGHHALPDELLPLPGNFNFEPYVPGLVLAERCDLMIHHGGYGSCQTGLFCGTPAVIIPTFSERESNARRVALLGAGEFILPETDSSGNRYISTAKFKRIIKQVLATSSYKEKAEYYSKKLRSYGGVEYAVQLIETFTEERLKRNGG